jgi:citronellol/citronellal dehydrogenase
MLEGQDLIGRVALITGASRGIGRTIALQLAAQGADICVAAKTVTPQPTLPGTIHSVAAEVRALGRRALAVQVDVRNDADVARMVAECEKELGAVDILICNSGALWWKSVAETPMSKFDLVVGVNVRAVFSCVRAALPGMISRGFGRIIVMSPPVDLGWLRHGGKVAYLISKFGMTMIAMGLAREVIGTGVSLNALWPATFIESSATQNFKMADMREWRKSDIVADAVAGMVRENAEGFNGRAVIDEEYLRSKGQADFAKYRCVADHEPVKVWPVPEASYVGPSAKSPNAKGIPPVVQARL